MYAQVLTPGHKVVLKAEGETHEVHVTRAARSSARPPLGHHEVLTVSHRKHHRQPRPLRATVLDTVNQEVLMALVSKLSPALVVVAILSLAGIQPGAAPEFGDWEPPVMLPGPINAEPTFAAVVSRDGLTMYCTRGTPPTTDLFV